MSWVRGEGSTDYELSRIQGWIEFWDPRLDGGNGKGAGMYSEWQDYKAQSKAFRTSIKIAVFAVGVICGIPALLVSLSALGMIHLR